jgi:cell division protein FtsW
LERRRRRHSAPPTWIVLATVVGVLCAIGLVMVLSASSVDALRRYGSAWLFFRRQVMWTAAGTIALIITARTDYRRWRKLGPLLLVVSGGLLLLVLIPGVGITVSGSTRWLGVGAWRMQPSELAKLAVLFFTADLLAKRADRMHDTRVTLRPVLLVFGGAAFLVMRQPDMGTTLSIASIVFVMLFVAGLPMRSVIGLVGGGAGLALLAGMAAPYRRARLMSFMDPFANASTSGYQVAQSLVGLASGRLAGVGVGASRAKWGFLPNAHTDFIFAIIGEEMGLLGSLLVVGLFGTFAMLGVRAATRAPDRYGTLVAAGITGWVVAQAFINIGAVIGILPVTGVPLPFVSFGGSSLVLVMAAVGVLVNIARLGEPATSVPSRRRPARPPA